jgi:hypothetical protein
MMETVEGIGITKAFADLFRVYHVREQLTEKQCEASELGPEQCGHVTNTIAKMPGVELCYVKRYQVTVHKAEMFSWEEVEPLVMEFLKCFAGKPFPDS